MNADSYTNEGPIARIIVRRSDRQAITKALLVICERRPDFSQFSESI